MAVSYTARTLTSGADIPAEAGRTVGYVNAGSDAPLHEFLEQTGAALVCGYTRTVDWVQSAAFETVLLDVLANGQKANAAELCMGSKTWLSVASYLGFRIVYANGRTWRPGGGAAIPRQTQLAG